MAVRLGWLVLRHRSVARSIVAQVCEKAEPLILPSIVDAQPARLSSSVRDLGLLSAMCVPLTSFAEP